MVTSVMICKGALISDHATARTAVSVVIGIVLAPMALWLTSGLLFGEVPSIR